MKSICLIIPYFGKWPAWFNMYLETCRHNPSVDWLFFTDCEIPKDAAQNTKFFKMSLDDFSVLASKKLGLKIKLKTAYAYGRRPKVSEYRPACGVIFEDYLKDYDFWGYSDIDVVYGDIRKFITDDMLETYDIITAKKKYIVGHFVIYKNCDKMNRLYQMARGYKRVFLYTNKWYNFGECSKDFSRKRAKRPRGEEILNFIMCRINRVCELLGTKVHFRNAEREVESMTDCVERLEKDGYLRSYFEDIAEEYGSKFKTGPVWKFCWNKGKLTEVYAGTEIIYFHFFALKHKEQFILPNWQKIPEKFFITKDGFFAEQESPEIIKK